MLAYLLTLLAILLLGMTGAAIRLNAARLATLASATTADRCNAILARVAL